MKGTYEAIRSKLLWHVDWCEIEEGKGRLVLVVWSVNWVNPMRVRWHMASEMPAGVAFEVIEGKPPLMERFRMRCRAAWRRLKWQGRLKFRLKSAWRAFFPPSPPEWGPSIISECIKESLALERFKRHVLPPNPFPRPRSETDKPGS